MGIRKASVEMLFFLGLAVVALMAPAYAQYRIAYSPVDSIIYAQYPSLIPFSPTYVLLRFHDGGSRIDRPEEEAPGFILTTDNVPGHIFVRDDFEMPYETYQTMDYGETWILNETMPQDVLPEAGMPGEHPGQGFLVGGPSIDLWYIYFTSDSWRSYDSLRMVLCPDSISFKSLSYQDGVAYGAGYGGRICISSDTGRTWSPGHPNPVPMTTDGPLPGAFDELWGLSWTHSVYMLRDTGGTAIDPVFVSHPPPRPYGWHTHIVPTDHPGEAYMFAECEEWADNVYTEIIVYHIRDYGARVDSSYYRLTNYQVGGVVERPAVPTEFSVVAFPNPFNATLTLRWEGPMYTPTRVKVTDLLGRCVWAWQGYSDHVRWDGHTSTGKPLPSGSYWVTVEARQDLSKSLRILLLR